MHEACQSKNELQNQRVIDRIYGSGSGGPRPM